MPDESSSSDLANSLIVKISLLGAGEVGRGLKEGRCDHNSTLLDAQTNEVCDACVRPISTPCYNCSECHLILHKSCAELPIEIQHPFHTLPRLVLQKMSYFRCDACARYCSGFSYGCRSCDFDLDINCASLPTTIRHEAHEHPLNLVDDECDEWCSCCHGFCKHDYKFRCRDCKFNLHIECASLPQTLIRHRYDRHHALILKYTPVGIKPEEEYYCEICEEEMNMKLWFYYCSDCNYAFHTKCLCTAAEEYANVKLGTIINVINHPHPLTLARKANYKLRCDECPIPFNNFAIGTFVFDCKECEFTVDFICGLLSRIV